MFEVRPCAVLAGILERKRDFDQQEVSLAGVQSHFEPADVTEN